MSECLVAVASEGHAFGFDALVDDATTRWPGVEFIPSGGELAPVSYGRLQVLEPGTEDVRLIAVLLAGERGIGLEGIPEDLAEFISWLSHRSGFPDDGSVLLLGWSASGQDSLGPGTSTEDLMARFE